MGKLVVLIALAAGGWWAFQNEVIPVPTGLAGPSEAWETYTRFNDYLAHDQYGNAGKLATRGASRIVKVQELRGRRNTKLGISRSTLSKDEKETRKHGEVTGVSYERISETASPDGRTVTIEAVARVCRQGGCNDQRQRAEVCQLGDGWKVCSFSSS